MTREMFALRFNFVGYIIRSGGVIGNIFSGLEWLCLTEGLYQLVLQQVTSKYYIIKYLFLDNDWTRIATYNTVPKCLNLVRISVNNILDF